MLDEIHEQPQVLQKVIDAERANVLELCRAIKDKEIRSVVMVARGTSDNAAVFGKYLFEIANGIPVSLAAPSVITLYNAEFDLSNTLVIGISQSGESTDVVEFLKRVKGMGALTAGITNVNGSELTQVADYTLLCHAGEEKSVAATKTYTTTLALIYMISDMLVGEDDLIPHLEAAVGMTSRVFQVESRIEEIAQRYRYMEECKVVARGMNYATSKEAALKLAETCYVSAEPFSMADLMHGPIAVVDAGFPVFMYAPPGKGYPTMMELAQKLEGWDVETIIFSSEEEILKTATIPVKLPVVVDEPYSPLVYIVAGQLFAQYLSVVKGHDPDRPRGLSKVTLTL